MLTVSFDLEDLLHGSVEYFRSLIVFNLNVKVEYIVLHSTFDWNDSG